MNVAITAVICTYNRAEYLRKAINSLIFQTLDRSRYEILIIDNCSKDGTESVVKEEFAHLPNIRYLFEPVLGLSQARNTGWQNASGAYVAYLDDDAIAAPEWLESALGVFEKVVPLPGAVGGKIELIWESPRPAWLSDNLLGCLGFMDLDDEPRFLAKSERLAGGNCAYPKTALEAVGGFSTEVGRVGDCLISNEEVLLYHWLKNAGFLLYYHPEMKIGHHVAKERLEIGWFEKRVFWQGISDVVTENELHGFSIVKKTWEVVQILATMVLKPQQILASIITIENLYFVNLRMKCKFKLGKLRGIMILK